MRQRIVGLDLNGRFDMAARDWSEEGVDSVQAGEVRLVLGGTTGAVVTTCDGRLAAGPQAALAPHGRGQGWGDIGDATRRRSLAGAFNGDRIVSDDVADIRAGVEALARGSDHVVAAVPDLARFDEVAQGAVLKAMSVRRRRVRLLWRSVAAFIDLLATSRIDLEAEGARFRILVHTGGGIEEQTLTLRSDRDHPGHFAPERASPGALTAPEAGLDAMFARATTITQDLNASVAWERCEPSRLGPRLLTGSAMPGEVEILRNWNGNWVAVTAPEIDPGFFVLDAPKFAPPPAPVAATFLVTPLATLHAKALASAIARTAGPVELIGSEAIARGCLRAGRLIERGLPHYFDRLEPVAIAVLRGDEPEFMHLIPPDSVVPADREFISRELSDLEWGKGKTAIDFYVLKGAGEVRHWQVTKNEGPPKNVPVALRVRQTPGQSWARLSITSSAWETLARSPVALDWETLTPIDLAPAAILEKLRTPPPTIPDRIVERPHPDMWMGSYWTGGNEPAKLARAETRGEPATPDRWAAELRQSRRHPDPPRERFWLVGTDGDLPEALSLEVRKGFELALERIAEVLCASTLDRPPHDNELLIALTWCFIRCPETVQDRILSALEAHARGDRHPFSEPRQAITVLRQGAGRAASGVPRLERLFNYLDHAPLNTDTLNALAMALTRRNEAPEALTRDQVERFLDRLGHELIARIQARDFNIRFRNTLSAIAGLFRWRKREPFALLAARDDAASKLRGALSTAKGMLERAHGNIPQRPQKVGLIMQIIDYLDGQGDPDILRRIED